MGNGFGHVLQILVTFLRLKMDVDHRSSRAKKKRKRDDENELRSEQFLLNIAQCVRFLLACFSVLVGDVPVIGWIVHGRFPFREFLV